MKRAIICAINSKYIHSNPAVYSLAAYYEKHSVNKLWHTDVREYTINDIVGNIIYDIVSDKPDVIAFSVYIWNVEVVKRILCDLRVILPNTVIILGGPEVSFGTEHCNINDSLYDYIIQGEGELCFTELLDNLSSVSEQALIDSDVACVNKILRADRLLAMDEIPFIYNDENIGCFKNRILYYETARGCPFSCAYCLSGGDCSPVRFTDVEIVFTHIDFFCKHDVPLVKFVDRTFNCNPARAKEIIKKIAAIPDSCSTCFHFEVGADLFDDDFLCLLSTLPKGRVQIEAGIQSLNETTLNASVRKTDNNKVFSNLKKIIDGENVNVHTDLIAGLPFESLASFKNSFNGVYRLKSHQLQLGFLKRLQGAPLCDKEDEYGMLFSQTAPYEIIKTKWLDFYDIMELRRVEATVERYYNSGCYTETLKLLCPEAEDAYSFYNRLALYSEEKGELFAAVSRRRAFDLLFEFVRENTCLFKVDVDDVAETMLFDYFSSDKSELPPDSLRFRWRHSRAFRNRESDIFKSNGIHEFTGFGIRYIGGKMYIFDYNTKDAVTGRFAGRIAHQ